MPGWTISLDPDKPAQHTITTPTDHTYTTTIPPALGPGSNRRLIGHRRTRRRLEFLKQEQIIRNLPSA